MLRLLLAAGLLLLLGPLSVAQVSEQDPRFGDDPRDSADPRIGEDPRVGEDPRESPPDPYGPLEGAELFEALYSAGELGRLKIAMRENAWSLLPFIDSYCNSWLALAERPEPLTDAQKLQLKTTQEKGMELARMADSSLGNTRFTAYVGSIQSWSVEQRELFKQEQESYELGMQIWRSAETPEHARAALTPLNQALDHARSLGDTWGESSAYTMIGRVQVASGELTEGRENVNHAVRVGRQIRDMDAVWDGLAISYETAVQLEAWEQAREALKDQYLISLEVGDEETTEQLMALLIEFDQFLGQR